MIKLDLRTMNRSESSFPSKEGNKKNKLLDFAVSPNGKYVATGGETLTLVGPSE